ncbi:universal stress protein [Pseudonocardia acaciae]|uniref:universal stress protein n=1 Tax=Pseudonocardia acaciae TaxID=551276 RepID=UPI00048EFD80|nr:universal stress protein [Pseudonocardia acaciae]
MESVTPNPGTGDGPGVILVAVDGSTTSVRAAAWAAGLARRQGSRLLCMYVATRPALAGLALSVGADIPVDAGPDGVAEELGKEVMAGAANYDVPVEYVVRSGDPVTEIIRVADELRVDAVVVGASTQAGHRLIGSVAVRLVRAGRWPVTVVP